MVVRNSPSGRLVAKSETVSFDWGTVAAGDAPINFIPHTPPPGLVPFVSIIGPIADGVFGFGIWSGNGIFAQMFNFGPAPIVVGSVSYILLLINPRVTR